MKTALLFFLVGGIAGALSMRLVPFNSSGGHRAKDTARDSESAVGKRELSVLKARLAEMEKELVKSRRAKAVAVNASLPDPREAPAEVQKMSELERLQDLKEMRREADRLTLALSLKHDQKEALEKFLTTGRDKQRTAYRVMADGNPVVLPEADTEAFMRGLLTDEQQTAYARFLELERKSQAEDFAQGRVRKLRRELHLSDAQKDKLFQAYARQKLESVVVQQQRGAGGPVDSGAEVPPDTGRADREIVARILTPEQLAVYDLRQKDEVELTGSIIRVENGMTFEDLPVSLEQDDDEDEWEDGMTEDR